MYRVRHRSTKYYMHIVFYCIGVAVVNGWLPYCRHMHQKRVPEFPKRSTNLAIYSITILVSEKNVNMVWSACITYSCLIRTASRQSRSLVSHNASHSSRMSTATARKSSQFDCSDPLLDLNMPAILIKRNAGLTLNSLNAMRSNSWMNIFREFCKISCTKLISELNYLARER